MLEQAIACSFGPFRATYGVFVAYPGRRCALPWAMMSYPVGLDSKEAQLTDDLLSFSPLPILQFHKRASWTISKMALISLLNAILDLPSLIVDVTIVNPYNLQDFKDDKLSILDVWNFGNTHAGAWKV